MPLSITSSLALVSDQCCYYYKDVQVGRLAPAIGLASSTTPYHITHTCVVLLLKKDRSQPVLYKLMEMTNLFTATLHSLLITLHCLLLTVYCAISTRFFSSTASFFLQRLHPYGIGLLIHSVTALISMQMA